MHFPKATAPLLRSLDPTFRRFAGVMFLSFLVWGCGDSSAVDPAVETIVITGPRQADLLVGAGLTIRLMGTDGAGRERQLTGTWRTSDGSVVRVDGPGVFRAIGVGSAFVVGSYGGKSDSIRVSTRPAGLSIEVEGASSAVLVGQSYRARVQFRDANGGPIDAPLPVEWTSSASAQLVSDGHALGHTVFVRVTDSATVSLRATASGLVANKVLLSLRDAAYGFRVVSFTVGALPGAGAGRSMYVPDIIVATGADVQVTRISFLGGGSACGNAMLVPHGDTPLFDFQPYNYVWTGATLPLGTPVEATIHLLFGGGGERVVSATTLLRAHNGVIDHGTDGFSWTECK